MTTNIERDFDFMHACLKRLTINPENVEKVIFNAEKIQAGSTEENGREELTRAIRLISESMSKVIGENQNAEVIKKLEEIPEVSDEEAAGEIEVLQMLEETPKAGTKNMVIFQRDNQLLEDNPRQLYERKTSAMEVAVKNWSTQTNGSKEATKTFSAGKDILQLLDEYGFKRVQDVTKTKLSQFEPNTVKEMAAKITGLFPDFQQTYVEKDGQLRYGKRGVASKRDLIDGIKALVCDAKLFV